MNPISIPEPSLVFAGHAVLAFDQYVVGAET